jgi:hypothetical protein
MPALTNYNLLPYSTLYVVDLAMLFWNGFNNDIQQQGEAADAPYLPPSRPQGQIESKQQADSRLRSVKDAAAQFKKQLDKLKHRVTKHEALSITAQQPLCFPDTFTQINPL